MPEKNKDPEEHLQSVENIFEMTEKIQISCKEIVKIAYNLKHSLKGSVDVPPDEIDALYQEIMKNKQLDKLSEIGYYIETTRGDLMKDIVGYEGKYTVDSQGTVWSMNYRRTGKIKALKRLKESQGYFQVGLSKNSKLKKHLIHRLVAQAYLDDYSEDLQVDHIDRDKTNNCLSNLRMVTRQQNGFNRSNTKGYSWHKQTKKWQAYIILNGKMHYLGLFVNEHDARQAYLDAKEKMHIIPT